jgi:hypothetical protein
MAGEDDAVKVRPPVTYGGGILRPKPDGTFEIAYEVNFGNEHAPWVEMVYNPKAIPSGQPTLPVPVEGADGPPIGDAFFDSLERRLADQHSQMGRILADLKAPASA